MSKKPENKGKIIDYKKVDKSTYVNKKIHMFMGQKMLINMWIMWITIQNQGNFLKNKRKCVHL